MRARFHFFLSANQVWKSGWRFRSQFVAGVIFLREIVTHFGGCVSLFFLFFVVGVKNVRCIFHAEEGASGKASLNQKCQHTHTERALLALLRKIVGNIEAEGV